MEIESTAPVEDPQPAGDGVDTMDLEAAVRLVRALGPARTKALLSFLEGSAERDFTIVRDDGADAAPARRVRPARQATG
jgi:hypothetical protein